MEEKEIEAFLIKSGSVGELIERKAVKEEVLPIFIYEESLKSINETITGFGNFQLKISYLQEQKERLIKAKLLYGYAFNTTVNHNASISVIEDLIKFVDEKLHAESWPKNILQEEKKQRKEKPELTISQIALIFVFENKLITRKNADELVKDYGYNSGESLFQKFTKYSSRSNRIGKEDTPAKNKNKIELFEKVITKLSKEARKKAMEERATLQAAINKAYE